MKYGVLEHRGIAFDENDNSNKIVNVGDAFQIMAVKHLYSLMGISEKDIIHVDWLELGNYSGEYVVLPINLSMFINSGQQSFADMSPYIIPVFIGASFKHTSVDEKQLDFFKKHEPIGCRDERTMEILRNHHIEAYLAGCIACTLPEIESKTEKNKVFFVDAPAMIKDYIPEAIVNNTVCLTHEYFVSKEQIRKDPSSEKLASEVIHRYVEEARLVVTSRFHSACLCIALGIPVILALENNYYKFSWLSKLLPLYTPDKFGEIDWNPKALDFREMKTRMKEVAINRIQSTFEAKKYYELSEYFENNNRSDDDALLYYHEACRYLDEKWDAQRSIQYAFWGMTENAMRIDEHISQKYPKAELVGVYDTFKEGEYRGIEIKKPTKENMAGETFIIVTSNSAADIAKELFDTIEKPEESYFICRLNFLKSC